MLDDKLKVMTGEFPGGQLLGLWAFTAKGPASIPGQGTRIPQAARHGQKKKK